MKQHHVMLDLETMGSGPDAAIVAIGAVKFNKRKVAEKDFLYQRVSLQSSVDSGGVIDPSTVIWWLKQSDEARAEVVKAEVELSTALDRLRYFCRNAQGVWGNGAGFDNVIVHQSCKRLGAAPCWDWWKDRCYRTEKSKHPKVKLERRGVHHNALDDARSQAEHMIAFGGLK